MKDMLLKASVNASLAKDRVADKLGRAARGESGDVVQVILIIALFVVIVLVVGRILTSTITTQANNVGNCISTSNASSSAACKNFK
jgi:hypothetical protein